MELEEELLIIIIISTIQYVNYFNILIPLKTHKTYISLLFSTIEK